MRPDRDLKFAAKVMLLSKRGSNVGSYYRMLSAHTPGLQGTKNRLGQRLRIGMTSLFQSLYTALNQLAAAVLLALLSPLLIYVSWRIYRQDGAPVIFAHYRVGQHGKLYRCFKFRSMLRNSSAVLSQLLANDPSARAEWERTQKLRDDPRVTPIGRFLRKTSLDELPQLFNVLRGEMNLVGPRPIVVQELRRYGVHKKHYLAVKPGLTGLWQVSGRSDTSYEQRVSLDTHYVRNRSLRMDAQILYKTLFVVFARDGAY